ncbi:Mic60 protein [Starmerella bacillaris]|uniref:MICOS complex subunit MIC60 n=1 Tax=Starmerella bacillaris TaxID=1247836 RepID=A0AAV5RP09_STABA|nr:Mic60 protein [Starmerella bacillaris]
MMRRLINTRLYATSAGADSVKSGSKFKRFFYSTAALVSAAYGGTVYYAMCDDDFYDKFSANIPLCRDIINALDTYDLSKNEKALKSIRDKQYVKRESVVHSSSINYQTLINESSMAVNDKLHDLHDKVREKEHSAEASAKSAQKSENTQQAQNTKDSKSTAVAVSSQAEPNASLDPSEVVNEIQIDDVDPLLREMGIMLNSLLHQNPDLKGNKNFQQLVNSLQTASENFKQEKEHVLEQFKQTLDAELERFEGQVNLNYQEKKKNLVAVYNERLQEALNAISDKAVISYNNKLLQQYSEQKAKFAEKVAQYVDADREGKLRNLDKLSTDVKSLQKLMLQSHKKSDSESSVIDYLVELNKLQQVLKLQSSEPLPLQKYTESIAKARPNDVLVQETLKSFKESSKTDGVLSRKELSDRFQTLEPEIRRSSLVRPGAGITGHIASFVASQFMFKKEGLPEGADIESIIARTNTYLERGDLVRAVAEINGLTGWPKQLAHDWLVEGRKRCEAEFLVDVLSTNGNLLAYK